MLDATLYLDTTDPHRRSHHHATKEVIVENNIYLYIWLIVAYGFRKIVGTVSLMRSLEIVTVGTDSGRSIL